MITDHLGSIDEVYITDLMARMLMTASKHTNSNKARITRMGPGIRQNYKNIFIKEIGKFENQLEFVSELFSAYRAFIS